MQLTLTLASKLASMMIYAIVGFIIVRAGVLKTSDSKPLTTVIVWVLQPCLIFNAFLIDITPERMRGFLVCMVFGLLFYVVFIPLTYAIKKPARCRAGFLFACMLSAYARLRRSARTPMPTSINTPLVGSGTAGVGGVGAEAAST